MATDGFIIFRNIPKHEARLDLTLYGLGPDFRGFQAVPPGLHYAAVRQEDGVFSGFWCFLMPGGTIVKAFDPLSGEFIDNDPDVVEHFAEIARSTGAADSLVTYNRKSHKLWQRLTDHIVPGDYPLTLRDVDGITDLGQLASAYGGDLRLLMAHTQFAFARWLLEPDDALAMRFWAGVVQASYRGAAEGVDAQRLWYGDLLDVLLAQFMTLPKSMFGDNSVATYGLAGLLAASEASGNAHLQRKAATLRRYLDDRGATLSA